MINAMRDWISAAVDRSLASRPSWVVVLQLFLGLGWARASVEKIIRPQWWEGADINAFIVDHDAVTVGWYGPIIDLVGSNALWLTAAVVLGLEMLIAMSLLTGHRVGIALAGAVFLNVNFVLAGQPNPSIFYLIMEIGLAMWLIEEVASADLGIRVAKSAAVTAAVLGLLSLPFVATLQPDSVIEDPAAVLAAGAMCTAIACIAAQRRIPSANPDSAIDLRTATATAPSARSSRVRSFAAGSSGSGSSGIRPSGIRPAATALDQ